MQGVAKVLYRERGATPLRPAGGTGRVDYLEERVGERMDKVCCQRVP